MADTALTEARRVAAEHLGQAGRTADAAIVARGGGDDFTEVILARRAASSTSDRADRLERALRCYADESFWEELGENAALAAHDRGEIARAALAGRELYALHRD